MAGPKRKPDSAESSGKRAKIGGVELSFELDSEIAKYFDQVNKPIGTYPKYIVQRPIPPSARERTQIAHYRDIRDRIRDGPHYAILGETTQGVNEYIPQSVNTMSNPFEDMPTYAHSYKRVKRKIPKLDTRSYELRFFPEQLWTLLDPEKRELTEEEQAVKKRKMAKDRLERIGDEEDEEVEGKGKKAGVDDDEDAADSDEDADAPEEELDDAFDDDEDDLEGDNDYNALQYWKEDDEGEGDDDGGGGFDD